MKSGAKCTFVTLIYFLCILELLLTTTASLEADLLGTVRGLYYSGETMEIKRVY